MIRIDLDGLRLLDAIARRGSFAAAAEEMHRVPSAVTYGIQKLEQDLGVILFDRSGHRATLTEAGRELLQEGRHLLRAAAELEERVRQVARGFETELRIALSDLIPLDRFYPLLETFYVLNCATRIKLSREVYGGTWDALATSRADLVIGAPGEAPPGGGLATRPLGVVEFVFAIAPGHPLAGLAEPLQRADIQHHRAVVASDSSRNLPPRTSGLLSGQDTLAVPDTEAKLEAHRRGLGVGYLPRQLVLQDLARGTLICKEVEEPKPQVPLFLAWRSGHRGKALDWFIQRVEQAAAAGLLV
ncbi:LysR substrate-binding domain-containing protein [Methylococcus capsulatus]|uniref:LysR substrate-binding domain-containing protein n=1 Tax=Methylococcus capsulatus TaxID=414 RepID=UPI002FD94EB3